MFSPANFVSVSRRNLRPRRHENVRDTDLTTRKLTANPLRRAFSLSRHSLALTPLCGATVSGPNVSLASRHCPARRGQSSHPDIESHANPMKKKAETFFNRHTFAFFAFTRHTPLICDLSPPLSPAGSSFPFRNSSHAGGRGPRNPLKTNTDKNSSRHTHACLCFCDARPRNLGGREITAGVRRKGGVANRLRFLTRAKWSLCSRHSPLTSSERTTMERRRKGPGAP